MSSLRPEVARRVLGPLTSRSGARPRAVGDAVLVLPVPALRAGAVLLAVVAASSVALQVWLTADGAGPPARVWHLLLKFPVQAALLVLVASVLVARDPGGRGLLRGAVLHAALLGAWVTVLVYVIAMRSTVTAPGWPSLAATGLHYVVPGLAIGGWLLLGPRGAVRWSTALLCLLWPLAWMGVTIAHAASGGVAPYPFVDVARFGYPSVVGDCLAVLGMLGAVAALVATGERVLGAQRR